MPQTSVPKRGAPKSSITRRTTAGPSLRSVRTLARKRDEIVKAQVFRPSSRQAGQPDEADPTWEGVGVLPPPYEPYTLLTLFEHSNSLRQCVDAYVTNIDAFGHRFEPIIDLNAADADNLVRQYLISRAAARFPTVVLDPTQQVPAPDDETIARAKAELSEKMAAEGLRLQHFYDYACLDYSFVTLRRRTRQDLEIQGNAYWECMRAMDGSLAGFEYVPGFTIRHMPADDRSVGVEYKAKTNQFDYDTIKTTKRFRKYVQVYETRTTYFKEFGDPRLISKTSGRVFASEEEMKRADGPHAVPASEILHFRVHTAKSSYGIPRWVGTLLSVIGSRQAEEVNVDYFESKSVPPLAILVSGGRISQKTVDRVQDFIENDIKGKKNYHKILLLEAETSATAGTTDTGKMKIDLKPLTAAQHNDALFQNYDERNIDKVGMAFRLPRMLRGDIRDFNRATALAALDFAESQVFKPERDEFDFLMNRKILPALGIRFWKFVSNAATTQNINDLAEIILSALEKGAIVPAEARDLLEKVFNRPFRKMDAPWASQPLALTLNGIAPPSDATKPGMVTPEASATGVAPGAPGQPLQAPLEGALAMGGGSVKLTGTDAASVVTVNESRASMGYGNLQRPPGLGGGDDPDGFLTVAEFKAKRMSLGQTQGAIEGGDETPSNSPHPALAASQPKAASMPAHQQRFNDQIANLLMLRKAMEWLDKQELFQGQPTNDAAAE